MMSSGWQTKKPSTSTRRLHAYSNVPIPPGAKTRSGSKRQLLTLTTSLPRRISPAWASVSANPSSISAATRASPFAADFSTNTSASCVVSGNPSKIAPDLPRKRYRTPCREKASRISSAWMYSNRAPITQPAREIGFTPGAIIRGGREGSERRVVEDGLVGVDEGVAEAYTERAARRCFELGFPYPLVLRVGLAPCFERVFVALHVLYLRNWSLSLSILDLTSKQSGRRTLCAASGFVSTINLLDCFSGARGFISGQY